MNPTKPRLWKQAPVTALGTQASRLLFV